MFDWKGIQERLRKLEKAGDISNVGDQARRDPDRTCALQA
jgi:hypothetical protein